VRVRTFELRLIALALASCWVVAATYVLIGYRPGGPIDVAVGVVALIPAAVALAGVVWPPVARGDRGFMAMLWLAAASLLVLVPSIADVAGQLGGRGAQTLLPSAEAAYPWVLGLIGTCLFTGFGIARKRLGEAAMRRRRVARGILLAGILATCSAIVFATVAMANELALRDQVAASSRFGPTGAEGDLPTCDGPIGIGHAAQVVMHLDGTMDNRSLGSVDVSGERSTSDVRWLAYVASNRGLGLYGQATVGDRSWFRPIGGAWEGTTSNAVAGDDLDRAAFRIALTPEARATAESRGVGLIEGARARQCRIAIDGPTFLAAFPQAKELVGDADLAHWRGELDYWVFLDDQIGRIEGSVNGDAADIQKDALQATVRVALTATDRDQAVTVSPPGP
jgi:hypothetical protein